MNSTMLPSHSAVVALLDPDGLRAWANTLGPFGLALAIAFLLGQFAKRVLGPEGVSLEQRLLHLSKTFKVLGTGGAGSLVLFAWLTGPENIGMYSSGAGLGLLLGYFCPIPGKVILADTQLLEFAMTKALDLAEQEGGRPAEDDLKSYAGVLLTTWGGADGRQSTEGTPPDVQEQDFEVLDRADGQDRS